MAEKTYQVSDSLSSDSNIDKDADFVPETPQRHCNENSSKRNLKLEEKQKPTFQLLLRPKVESDEGENVSAINAEGQKEVDDEGNVSNSSSIYTVKEREEEKDIQ